MKYLRSVVSMQNLPNDTPWTEQDKTEAGSQRPQRNNTGGGQRREVGGGGGDGGRSGVGERMSECHW